MSADPKPTEAPPLEDPTVTQEDQQDDQPERGAEPAGEGAPENSGGSKSDSKGRGKEPRKNKQKSAKGAKGDEQQKPDTEEERPAGPGKRSRLRWKKKEMPGGLWLKCEKCDQTIYRKDLEEKGSVCPACGFHFTLNAPGRVKMVLDEGTWKESFAHLESLDRLKFTDQIPYSEKVAKTVKRTGQKEALVCGTGEVEGRPVVLAILDFSFMGGSMGEVVGEKVALACELARIQRKPLIIFTSSGGARMHEGMLSLLQMAKTSASLASLNEAGGLSVCVMTNPTTGGVTASFASVCDLTLAEPGALIGFAGPRVIATTLKQELPPGFQRAEFLLERGQVDMIVHRKDLRSTLARLIDYGERAWGGEART